jgi:hypothetical protein
VRFPELGWRGWLFVGVTAAAIAAALLAPPFPQPLSYHDFADDRDFAGIPNFLNVISNVPFLLAGSYGMAILLRRRNGVSAADERLAYAIFFLGTLLTAFGSAYYHAAPDNGRLVWDRLPMTLGFAGLAAAIIGERIDRTLGRRALWPLLVVGLATVLHWSATERGGNGNVLPYALYQVWTMAVVALAAIAYPARHYTHGAALWWVVALYAAAKIAEALDLGLYRMGHMVSGHTLKHLLAAAAVFAIAEILRRRASAPNPLLRGVKERVPKAGEAA